MLPLLAALPIAVCAALMAGRDWPARRALPVGWAIAAALAAGVWGMGLRPLAAYSMLGALKALDILLILYGALAILHVLKRSGAIEVIAHGFDGLARDARQQAVLIGWLFGAFIEGMAGYGTPAALAGPLLVGLGFPPLAAVAAALVYNCTPVSFAAGGVPIEAAVSTLEGLIGGADPDAVAYALGARVALLHAIAGTLLPLAGLCMLTRFFGAARSIKPALDAAPFALFAGLAFTVPSALTAHYLGPEFPSIFGAIAGLALVSAALRAGLFRPRTPMRFLPGADGALALDYDRGGEAAVPAPAHAPRAMPLWRAWAPYAAIAALLLITRIPAFGLRGPLRALTLGTPDLLGIDGARYTLAWAFNPGILPFLAVALAAAWLHGLRPADLRGALADAARQVSGAAMALVAGVAMVQVMLFTGDEAAGAPGMIASLAAGAAAVAGRGYFALSPYVGLLGAFLSGSNTVSNILFSAFQYKTALLLALDPITVVAMQVCGGATGSMIGFNTTVAACTAVGLKGVEGAVLRRNALPCLAYAALIAIAAALLCSA